MIDVKEPYDKAILNVIRFEDCYERSLLNVSEVGKANDKALLDFVEANKAYLAAFYAIRNNYIDPHTTRLIPYAEAIAIKFPDNKSVQEFVKEMVELKTVSVGAEAPDFELNTAAGVPVKLADFRRRYVLIDFWDSKDNLWRSENLHMAQLYNT